MNQSALQKKIMRRVYVLYVVHKLKEPVTAEFFLILGFVGLLSFLVSLPHVVSNIILTRGSSAFLIDAFSKAQIIVKLVVLSALITTGLFIWNVSIRTTHLIKTRLA